MDLADYLLDSIPHVNADYEPVNVPFLISRLGDLSLELAGDKAVASSWWTSTNCILFTPSPPLGLSIPNIARQTNTPKDNKQRRSTTQNV